ncbi:hypothetical protein O6H91_18G060500 [Diphasiastrum complanatum]|uniref:Uncharacterized protein n=1 Tax=Diphasiastrum complanatum TaxID=34168 RepID=A0ACC2B1T1_DIPCM|nr:hypothetical protein O6H91_18G060500 [Diphasiastrum complanatum]
MAFHNDRVLALDALASSGFIVPWEQRAALHFSLGIKKDEAGLISLGLWGRVFTHTGKDYLLAQGCNAIQRSGNTLSFDLKCYYSQDGAKWLDLQPLTDENYELCKSIEGCFRGDPSHVYPVIVKLPPEPPRNEEVERRDGEQPKVDLEDEEAEGNKKIQEEEEEEEAEQKDEVKIRENDEEDEDEGEGEQGEAALKEELTKTVEIGELDRLSALIRAVDHDCGVVPFGALILDAKKQLLKNSLFPGLRFPEKLDSYGHLFQGYQEASLLKDITGSWSIQVQPISNDIVLQSLWWPGYAFYYSNSTKNYGGLYFGMGEKNIDFAFMI